MSPLFPLDLVPESEILNRIRSIQTLMSENGTQSILLTHRPDIYYFTGTAQEGWVTLCRDDDPLVFIKRYLPRAAAETPLENVIQVDSITRIPEEIASRQGQLPKTMGLAFDLVPVRDYHFFKRLFPETRFQDATPMIQQCRGVKSEFEIRAMEEAAQVSAQIFRFIRENIRPGISETAFSGQIEARARALGHSGKIQMRHYRSEGFSFHMMSGRSGGLAGALDSPVCGTGTCTAYPFGAGPGLIQANEPVLVDYASMVRGYHMDESRVFCVGKLKGEALAASEASIDLLFALKEAMRPGAVIQDLFEASVDLARTMGFDQEYLGLPGLKSAFVGHGIGLELVEPPILARNRSQALEPGMVFAVEPKFIYKDRFAAGIESVILVTPQGSRFISQTPHQVFKV